MPFKSEKQKNYMYAHHPRIAARWDQEYSDDGVKKNVEDGKEDIEGFMEGEAMGGLESKVLKAIMEEMDEYETENKLKPLMVKVDIVGGKPGEHKMPGGEMMKDSEMEEDEFEKLLKSKMR